MVGSTTPAEKRGSRDLGESQPEKAKKSRCVSWGPVESVDEQWTGSRARESLVMGGPRRVTGPDPVLLSR
jgi:hypothetical protein